jgi:hypothetical protein
MSARRRRTVTERISTLTDLRIPATTTRPIRALMGLMVVIPMAPMKGIPTVRTKATAEPIREMPTGRTD